MPRFRMVDANVTNGYEANESIGPFSSRRRACRGMEGGTSVNEMLREETSASTTDRVGDKAGELAGRAQEKVAPAVGQAQDRVRVEVDRRSTQAGDQLTATAEALRHTSQELRTKGNEPHAKVTEAAADRMDQVGDYLRGADADRILADVEDLARRQPMVVAAGGLMLGLVAARVLKASSDRRYEAYRTRTSSGRAYEPFEPYGTPTSSDLPYEPYGTRTSER